jgi:hypothetical protein
MDIFDSNLNPFSILIKARNQAVDSVFYDTSSLTLEEWLSLTPWVDKKGKIIVVPPTSAREKGVRDTIRHYPSADLFVKSQDWHEVHGIAVAGVGSSVIGTAALARNVADYFDGPVAGIVSGYGLSDVVLEGLGGWFFYGKLDQFRYDMQNAVADLSAVIAENFARGSNVKKFARMYFDSPLDAYIPSNPDVSALHDVLFERYQHGNGAKNLCLLVGHSKGNLLISAALNHMCQALRDGAGGVEGLAFRHLAVVTFGAVVDLPNDLILEKNQHQFLGTLDVLGLMNSRRSAAGDMPAKYRVPGEWHSLNTKMPGHMDVKKCLEAARIPKEAIPDDGGGLNGVITGRIAERRNRVAAAMSAMAAG